MTHPHSSVASEFLLYRTEEGRSQLQVRLDGDTVWLTQAQLTELYQISKQTISHHLRRIFEEAELRPEATVRRYLTVQPEGPRQVRRVLEHYNLEAILAVGYRVRSLRGTQFRRWATEQLRELLVKGFVLDDARLAEDRALGGDYFDELLERIRAIRASERRFYQKITDIYSTAVDYDADSAVAEIFFATVQNKLHWAIHGHTAAEIVHSRADADRPNMGLATWKNAPGGAIRKADVTVAKNYLTAAELSELNRIVSMYLDYAELQAQNRRSMTMEGWADKLDAFLAFNERNVLEHAGRVSHELARARAEAEYERFEARRREIERSEPSSDFDRLVARVDRTPTHRSGPRRRKP